MEVAFIKTNDGPVQDDEYNYHHSLLAYCLKGNWPLGNHSTKRAVKMLQFAFVAILQPTFLFILTKLEESWFSRFYLRCSSKCKSSWNAGTVIRCHTGLYMLCAIFGFRCTFLEIALEFNCGVTKRNELK